MPKKIQLKAKSKSKLGPTQKKKIANESQIERLLEQLIILINESRNVLRKEYVLVSRQ